jgi:polyketide synthase PksJ
MNKTLNEVIEDSIAIIGMAGCFPGADDIGQFWQNIISGRESISFFSNEEMLADGVPPDEINRPNYVKAKGIIKDSDKFDAKFFGILPKDALLLDPQQRILLECAWHALEDAGYVTEEQAGRVGVFVGCGYNTYHAKILLPNKEFADKEISAALGNANDYVSTRVSYKFNFTGPSLTVQTACSTSLVAVSLACNSLLDYQSDMAVAGGSSAFFPINSGYHYQKEFILSNDGHCRALDAAGTGTVFSMGAGIVILKRLADALRDRDHIYAVIRGTAINNDGGNKIGFTAPSQQGQHEVIVEAQTLAQVDPSTINFVELHATGTPIGDPIEVAALSEVFKEKTNKKNFCALGTLKANVGHLDAAAGVAGLIKTVLVLQNKKIPPAVNFQTPNPKINFNESPFYVPVKLEEWVSDGPRRAAVSSFGVGGTNAHVVLEEAPEVAAETVIEKPYLFTFSAKTETALQQLLLEFESWLTQSGTQNLFADISYTLNLGRKHFSKRCAIIASHLNELILSLPRMRESIQTGNVIQLSHDNEKLVSLAQRYLKGDETIDWSSLYQDEKRRRISMPGYPFERVRYWPESTKITLIQEHNNKLLSIVCEVSSLAPTDIDWQTSLFDLGLDSIVLYQVISKIESDFNIKLEDHLQEILANPSLENIAKWVSQTHN